MMGQSRYIVLVLTVGLFCANRQVDSSNSSTVRRGVMVTTASTWVNGTDERVCVLSHQIDSTVNVIIRLRDTNNVTHSEQSLQLSNGQSDCVMVSVAFNESVGRANLAVTAQSEDDEDDVTPYSFSDSKVVHVIYSNLFTFIETDKPVYKPSDLVRIRVLALRGPDLQIVTDPVTLVYVEDPSRTRLMQWRDLQNDEGIVDVEMQLSDEPPLGEWNIKATVNGQEHSRTFTVKEYVLPKFEVSITAPNYLSTNITDVTWKVCARYTYGEPVSGVVTATSACITHTYEGIKKCVHYDRVQLQDGCAELKANRTELGFPYQYWMTWALSLRITANVTERGTDVTLNAERIVPIEYRQLKVEFDDVNPKHFKPGFEYRGQGKVTWPDKQSSAEPSVEVYLEQSGRRSASWAESVPVKDGSFQFKIPASVTWTYQNKSLVVMVRESGASDSRARAFLKPWFSPSNSFIQIHSPAETLPCRSRVVLDGTVMMESGRDNEDFNFIYQIMSRGNIIDASSVISQLNLQQISGVAENTSVYKFNMTISLMPSVTGSVDIVVMYVRPDGETVADSQHILVEQCSSNEVTMQFSSERAQPGHQTSLRVKADRSSLCALAVVDKSVELMGVTSKVTRSSIADVLKKYELWRSQRIYRGYTNNDATCVRRNDDPLRRFTDSTDDYDYGMPRPLGRRRDRRMIAYPGEYQSEFADSKDAFMDAGMLTMTDLIVETRPCKRFSWRRHYVMAGAPAPDMAVRRNSMMPMAMAVPMRSRSRSGPRSEATNEVESAGSSKPVVLHRTFFPETWLWQLERMGDSGEKDISLSLPHTITEWVGNGFCVNPTSSIGVAQPFRITAFQPFFVSFTLPYSMVRGESVGVPVSVFNYLSSGCLQVTLTVERSAGFELVVNKSQSTVNTALLTVCARSTQVHSFRIVPRQMGQVNFTVHASSVPDVSSDSNTIDDVAVATAEDKVTRQLLVLSEGKEEEYTHSAYVCTSADDSSHGNWSLALPNDVIQDSVRTRISVIGDVMGPALSGLDKLLRLPTGCGEQNMLLFAPNIYVLEYLTNTDQLTPSLRDKALGFLRTGYQRELTYRHTDGSYSAFGNSDSEGSTWLTAFVIRSFARARPFIFIDSNDLQMSINWIKSLQLENGCFRSVGKVLHKDMKGGLQNDNNDSPVGLTAYIVISLLEANISNTDPAIENAMGCLATQSVDDIYTLALLSYGYNLYGRDASNAGRIREQLEAKATREAGMVYWKSPSQTSAATHQYYGQPTSSAAVEMTSYIMLGTLHGVNQSVASHVVPTVKWLTTQRNAYGGFASTQDTVVALQALSQFATLVYAGEHDSDTVVTVFGQGLATTGQTFTVNPSNRLVLQTLNNALTMPTTVRYSLTGSGCALVQAMVKYNRLSLSSDAEQPSFTLSVQVEQSESCKTRKLRICAGYNGVDSASNMAVVAIKMVSGWIPDKESIRKLKNDARLGLKRFDIDKDTIQLYFDEFDKIQRCWTVGILQAIEVLDTKPALVHIYDYYTPAASEFHEYKLTSDRCDKVVSADAEVVPQTLAVVRAAERNQPRGRRPDRGRQQQTGCPSCRNSTSEVQQLVCQASYAYRVLVKKRSTMKLLETLRATNTDASWNTTTIRYAIHNRCNCTQLARGSKVLVLTPKGLQVDPGNRRRLVLDLKSSTVSILSDSKSATRCV